MPTLYADFPLIGSHSFVYPCIVNSHIFWPNEERSCIILQFSSHANTNKNMMMKAVELHKVIFKYCIQFNYKGIENLTRIEVPPSVDK